MLARMFPSSRSAPKKRSFDPTADCLALPAQKKKKAFRAKPSNVTVVMMPEFRHDVPKGKRRADLKKANRIQVVQLSRSMSPQQVKNAIVKAFKRERWTVLECSQQGILSRSCSQSLDGKSAVSRKGSLYLCEDESEVGLICMLYVKNMHNRFDVCLLQSDESLELPPAGVGSRDIVAESDKMIKILKVHP